MKILLNILGILTFFLIRFINRSDKVTEPKLKFWIKDNKWELLLICLVDIQLVIFVIAGGLQIDLAKLFPSLPAGITFTGDWVLCALIGWFVSWLVYIAIKKKIEETK